MEAIFTRVVLGVPVQGWASLIVVVLVVSGAQLLMTGILGEYLWRTLEETRRRPRYVVDRTVDRAAVQSDPKGPSSSRTAA